MVNERNRDNYAYLPSDPQRMWLQEEFQKIDYRTKVFIFVNSRNGSLNCYNKDAFDEFDFKNFSLHNKVPLMNG